MEDHGLVTRAADPADSRGLIITITEEGIAKDKEFKAEKLKKAQDLFAGLSEQEKDCMAALFDKIQEDWYAKGLFYGDCKAHKKHLEKYNR